MAETWEEASSFASFLVAQIEDEAQLRVVAYRLMHELKIPFCALDDSDISNAITNISDNFGRELTSAQHEGITRLVKVDRAFGYIDMAEGWESAYEHMENIVYSKMADLGLTEEEEEEDF